MLQHQPVRDLRGIDRNTDTTDRRLGSFDSVENLVPWPEGALSAMVWTGATEDDGLGGDVVRSDCKGAIETALSGKDSAKAHLVRISLTTDKKNDLLCVWSLGQSRPLMLFPVYREWDGQHKAPSSYQCPGPLNGGAPESVTFLYADFDPGLACHASRIADRIIVGNGADPNIKYIVDTQTASEFAVSSPTFNDPAQQSFPPCKHFVMGQNREIYGTGNATNGLRVWASNKPGIAFRLHEGVQNTETSYTEVTLPGATKITGLSMWNNYISAHTDAGVVSLYGLNSVADTSGFKADQRPAGAEAAAASPDGIEDGQGQGAYYFGSDNQLYHDQAIRGSPFNKYTDSRIDSPLAQYGDCLQHMAAYGDGDYRGIVHDRERGLVYVATALGASGWGNALWCYNERNKAVTGPITGVSPDRVTSVSLGPNRITTMLAMTSGGVIHFSCGPQEADRPRNPADSSIEWDDGIYANSDGTDDKLIGADASAAGSGNYKITGSVRGADVSADRIVSLTSSDVFSVTITEPDTWENFETLIFTGTPNLVRVGIENIFDDSLPADWKDIRLIDADSGEVVAHWPLNDQSAGSLDGVTAVDIVGDFHGTHIGGTGGVNLIPFDSQKRTVALQASGDTNGTFAALEFTEDAQRTVFGDISESSYTATKTLDEFSCWAMIDTGFIDFGGGDREKTLREVRASLCQGHDYGVVAVVLDDRGRYRFKETYPGSGRTQPVLRVNIKGRRMRVVLLVARDIYTPLTLREVSYGLLSSRSVARG